MCPISYDEAYSNTNPDATPEARDAAAKAIQAGVAANDVYWGHVDPLTALRAQNIDGHGKVVTAHAETAGLPAADAEATAVDQSADPMAGLPHGDPAASPPPVDPSPQNPNAAIAALRKQLTDAGINPEA